MTKKTSQDIKRLNIRCFDVGEGIVNFEIPKTDYIKEHFNDNISPSHLVLDCGCGIGSVLLSLDCRRIGLDISIKNLKKISQLEKNINFVQGDAESLPFRDKSIDAVILAAALHHFPNYKRNIKEVNRILKDGGKVYIIEGNSIGLLPIFIPLWPLNIIRKIRGTYPEYEIHAGKISLTEVMYLLKINHFTITKLYGDNTFIGIYADLFIKHIPGLKKFKRLINLLRLANSMLAKCLPPTFKPYYRLLAVKRVK